MLERDGLAAVTVEAIAARAGVSKATIYRWWPNKAAVVADAFLELTAPEIGFVDTGSVRSDLKDQMNKLARAFSGGAGRAIAALVGEAQEDPTVAEAFRTRWISARREATRDVLRRAVERGQLRGDLDLEVAMDALYGPIYYRLLVGHAPLTEEFVGALADQLMVGLESRDSLDGA